MAGIYNTKNPAVKRILQEIREMQESAHDGSNFAAEPMAEDIFEWHFVIRGPADTEFANGLYHGRILLPPEYPFKPPSFVMLTPSGRFQTSTKICLSISSHHPEHWQPSWSMRTALMALIAFFPTPGKGAVGSLDFPAEDRRVLAQQSRTTVPYVSSAARREVMKTLHDKMLAWEEEAGTKQHGQEAADAGHDDQNARFSAEEEAVSPTSQPASQEAHERNEESAPVGSPHQPVQDAASPAQHVLQGRHSHAEARPRSLQVLDSMIFGVIVLIAAIFCKKFYQLYLDTEVVT